MIIRDKKWRGCAEVLDVQYAFMPVVEADIEVEERISPIFGSVSLESGW
jgi:hypothetical protein